MQPRSCVRRVPHQPCMTIYWLPYKAARRACTWCTQQGRFGGWVCRCPGSERLQNSVSALEHPQGGASGGAAQGQEQLAVRLRGGHAAAAAKAGARAAGQGRPHLRHTRRGGCRFWPARWRTFILRTPENPWSAYSDPPCGLSTKEGGLPGWGALRALPRQQKPFSSCAGFWRVLYGQMLLGPSCKCNDSLWVSGRTKKLPELAQG